MLSSPRKHRWTYQLHHPFFGEQTGTLLLDQRPQESIEHLLMKACSFFLYFHPTLEIERQVDQRHKPDLVAFNQWGDPCIWIDCGMTHMRKLKRISNLNHQAQLIIVKKTPSELKRYAHQAHPILNRPERVLYQSYDYPFLKELKDQVSSRCKWEVTVLVEDEQPSFLFITLNECESVSTSIIWVGDNKFRFNPSL